ncbi:phosphodiester glycosidase family protein [Verrucomicrobium sp. BvORR034]|uniref:phosphodiester glycosidase family protein n=1 Tax=Verrucomicrobium sp. BvORR034 TaxID=1396418 RepID=UPI002240F2A1|nr:phosphodiester glycosidase family protein [Verrucomicrobium sp. BvORR034]
MTRRLAMILLLVSGLPGDSSAQSQREVVSLGHEVAWSRKDLSNPLDGWLQVVTFDSSKVKVEVLARGTKETALPMHRWMTEENVIAGCNGGYFDPATFAPAGLQVVQGRATGEYQQFGEWGGGVGVRSGKAQIWTEKEILSMRIFEAESFVQCSPVLVDGVRRFTGAGEDVRVRRTFIAHDGGSLWAMGVTSRIGLRELAALLANQGPGLVGFKVNRALNLDGGPSSGLWGKDEMGKVVVHEKEMWFVKNCVVIRPLQK